MHSTHGAHRTFGLFRTGANAVARMTQTAGCSSNSRAGVRIWTPNREILNGLGASEALAWIGVSPIC